ncbi:hypothetical protein J1605_020393 [Eschrichtius robustus]|uniref:Uncharacterized protein n=1 Tax=Eschrichtius robustus TaxID=9764 RepID=A0AB34HIX6_ESCRO|nr:hypothetical protein J1605_020393 [Eschrichtius robustus]
MAATTGQGAGLSAVRLSGRFLYFRFFMLKGSFLTRQSRPPTGGTAGGFRCQPGPDPAVVLTLPVSDRGELPTAWRPVGRALESEAPPWPGVPPVPIPHSPAELSS